MFGSGASSSGARSSIFKKPAWIKAQPNTVTPTETTVDYFDRKGKTLAQIAEEDARKRRIQRAKKERQRSRQLQGKDEHADKRRRIGEESDGDDSGSDNSLESLISTDDAEDSKEKSPLPVPDAGDGKSGIQATEVSQIKPSIISPKKQDSESPKHSPVGGKVELPESTDAASTQTLDVPDDTDEKQVTVIDIPGDSESDDEFREIARRARELAKKRRLEEEKAASISAPATETDQISTRETPDVAKPTENESLHYTSTASNPIITILITSYLENTAYLVVKRRLNQRLGAIRQFWCQRQGFSEDDSSRIFLTWNGIRLYDSTSCRALGIYVDEDGNIMYKGRRQSSATTQQDLVMEAMTEELLAEHRKAREISVEGDGEEEKAAGFDEEKATAPEASGPALRVVLNAKGFDDFQVKIGKDATVASLLDAFSTHHRISPDKTIFLMFDGDKLDAEQTAGDLELEDMESLEVHFR